MTPAVAKPLLTVDEYWDFCQRPENADRRTELIRGEVVEMPRPTIPHGVVVTNVAFALKLYVRQSRRGGYVASSDAGVVLEEKPGTVVGPDVAYYTNAHKFADLHPKWSDVPPVLAVEILSPNDKPTVVNRKVRDYLRSGVRAVWVVDYEERTVSVYRTGQPIEVCEALDSLPGGDELPGFACPVAELFQVNGEDAPPPSPTA